LGCEQRHILNDFLSVDSGQPLSGWFSLKSILPKRGSAFYINGVIFGFSHGWEPLQLLRFLRFAHGCLKFFGVNIQWLKSDCAEWGQEGSLLLRVVVADSRYPRDGRFIDEDRYL
jgi:hypothetical protein